MTDHVVAARNAGAETRWRAWQARGAEGDRRRAVRMGTLTALIVIGLAVALLVQLV